MEKKMSKREVSDVKRRICSEEEEKVRVVSVIYYIARNGQLEHPHLIEVPLSSPHRILCLKDVINRLNFLRGQGMANSYSWSAKRRYKKGYVWQDLSENDFIYPCKCNGHDDYEYILKATHLFFQLSSSSSSRFTSKTLISPPTPKYNYSSETTCTSITNTEPWKLLASIHASTQTDENHQEKESESSDEQAFEEIMVITNNGEVTLPVSGNIVKESSSSSNMGEYYCRMENENRRMMKAASKVLMQVMRCVISSKKLHDSKYA